MKWRFSNAVGNDQIIYEKGHFVSPFGFKFSVDTSLQGQLDLLEASADVTYRVTCIEEDDVRSNTFSAVVRVFGECKITELTAKKPSFQKN
jgi:hypothetical protein